MPNYIFCKRVTRDVILSSHHQPENCVQVMASWPATFLRDSGAATGVALINSIGSIGGFMGPYIIG